jgi:hypothetical protein
VRIPVVEPDSGLANLLRDDCTDRDHDEEQ